MCVSYQARRTHFDMVDDSLFRETLPSLDFWDFPLHLFPSCCVSSLPAPLSVSSSSWSLQVGTSGPYFGPFISLSILSLHTVSPSPIVQMSVSGYQIYICNTNSAFNPKLRSPCVCSKLLQSCLALCKNMDHSQPGSSVHGILQARIVEWVAMFSSRGSYGPGD